MNTAKMVALANVYERELARKHLGDFCRRMFPGYIPSPHLDKIIECFEALERDDIRRAIINLPPRHAKSTTASQLAPAWFLGRNPSKNIILATHSYELSEKNSRESRSYVQDDRWPFDCRLAADSTSASRWNTDAGGGCYGVGVMGSITGRGADMLIIDDPIHDSHSPGERAAAWQWFTETAVPRLEPQGKILLLGTRFAEDDLFGRVLDGPDANRWTVLNLPAIAEEGDPLGRAVGEALWPEKMPIEELQSQRLTMGSRAFECQFQQNPVSFEGNMIKREWVRRYKTLPEFESVHMAVDCAARVAIENDWSAFVTLGVTKNSVYVIDALRRRVAFPDLQRLALEMFEKHNPSSVYIESASNGIPLIDALKRDTRMPVKSVTARGSKESRVDGITGIIEAGRLYFPEEADWLVDLERETFGFPNVKHDDLVDALVLGLTEAVKKKPFVGVIGMFGDTGGERYDTDGNVSSAWGDRAPSAGVPGALGQRTAAIMKSGIW